MSSSNSLIDRSIDALRSRSMLFLLAGVLLGWFVFAKPAAENHLYVELINQDEILIDSIRMEFGFDLNQSNLLTLQLKPGEHRTLVLNHPAGKGFNVDVHYNNGEVQSFCANRGVLEQSQQLRLKR